MRYKFGDLGFKRITISFVVIIAIALLNILVSSYILQKNKAAANRMVNVINPYVQALEEFKQLIIVSKMYTTNWVYLQNSLDDKEALKELHANKYPLLKAKLKGFVNKLDKPSEGQKLDSVFTKFEDLLADEKQIMGLLVTFDDYENPTKKFNAEDAIETIILPKTTGIEQQLQLITSENHIDAEHTKDDMIGSINRLIWTLLTMSIGLFLAVLIASRYVIKSISEPVLRMKNVVLQLGKGEFPKHTLAVKRNDVVGQMVGAVNALTRNFEQTAVFAHEIGKGNLNAEFDLLGEKDMLGIALIKMRDSLRIFTEDLEQKVRERTKEVFEKNAKLELAYNEIRDSIQYAKRIQEAILPSKSLISAVFPQSFVLYKPKDIVCGDFYWYAEKGDDIIFAAADCTGHGVPGALVTVVGNSILHEIVNISDQNSPAEILTQLDKKLIDTLSKYGQDNTNDGMDVALCQFNRKTNMLTFAGAKRPLYVYKNGNPIVIKGDNFPIGSTQYHGLKSFNEHEIKLAEGDTIYIFSDGYHDQFGGADDKKYMTSRFRDLLTEMQNMPMEHQHAHLEHEIVTWQGIHEQTDDILVMGIRF